MSHLAVIGLVIVGVAIYFAAAFRIARNVARSDEDY